MYKHVSDRFSENNIPQPYKTFHAPKNDIIKLNGIMVACAEIMGAQVEACGEPNLNTTGCISQKDIDILGLSGTITLDGKSDQRDSCLCPSNKRQLIKGKPTQCPNGCLYCFWKN